MPRGSAPRSSRSLSVTSAQPHKHPGSLWSAQSRSLDASYGFRTVLGSVGRLPVRGGGAFVFVARDTLGGFFALDEAGVAEAFGCFAVALGCSLVHAGCNWVGFGHGVDDTAFRRVRGDDVRIPPWEGVDS